MTVYADPLRPTIPNDRWQWREGCHLFADTLAELHRFAGRLGLAPYWLHRVPGLPHFDLTAVKRQQAIELGAVEVDAEFTVARRKARRRK